MRAMAYPAGKGEAPLHNALIIPRLVPMALVLLVAIGIGAAMYGNRSRWNSADFRIYYAWWSEFQRGIDPWNPPAGMRDLANPLNPAVSYCDYTPFYVIVFSPFAGVAQHPSYWLWMSLQVGALGFAMVLLIRELGPPATSSTIFGVAALGLLLPHVIATIHGAQPTFILLLLLTASWLLERRSHTAAAGGMLALATLLKAYPAVAGGYFLFRRRFRTLGWAVAFALIGVIVTGVGRWQEFLVSTIGVHDYRQVRLTDVLSYAWYAVEHFCARPQCNPWLATIAITATADVIILAACGKITSAASNAVEADGLCFGAWMLAALMVSPMSWDHELPLALPAYLFLIAGVARGLPRNRIAVGLFAVGAVVSIMNALIVPMRPFHLFFLTTAATFIAACVLIMAWSREPVEATHSCTG
jgi:Glycosyltransferase family 87